MNDLVEQHGYAQLGTFKLSPDHKLLAYTVDLNGQETFTLFVKDLNLGVHLFSIEGVVSVEWSQPGGLLYYTLANASKRPWRVYLRDVRGRGDDVLVYEDNCPKHFVDVTRTKNWQYTLINVNSKISSEVFLIDPKLPTSLRRVQERSIGVQYFVENHDGRLYILTNSSRLGTPNPSNDYRLVCCDVDSLASNNLQEVISADSKCSIEDIDILKNHLILFMRESGLPVVQILALDKFQLLPTDNISNLLRRIELPPTAAAVTAGANSDYNSSILRLSVSSPVMPEITYDVDLTTGEKKILQQVRVPGIQVDHGDGLTSSYIMEHRTAVSHDGVGVPLTIVSSRRYERRGRNPALLMGYGAYGELLDMSFSSDYLSLLDRGWVLAFAHVRGGGTLGKSWHAAGKLLNKKNSFLDFIACARFLVNEKYASESKLAAWGESAGGLLVAAAVNMQPNLFKAIVLKVPFLDILNTMLDSSLNLTEHEYDEWGDPSRGEIFHYIRGYSPYDNIKPGALYPAMLISASLQDTRVGFWEAAKWVAALRHLVHDDATRPILLRTSMRGGHFGEGGAYHRLQQVAHDYAFLVHTVEGS